MCFSSVRFINFAKLVSSYSLTQGRRSKFYRSDRRSRSREEKGCVTQMEVFTEEEKGNEGK